MKRINFASEALCLCFYLSDPLIQSCRGNVTFMLITELIDVSFLFLKMLQKGKWGWGWGGLIAVEEVSAIKKMHLADVFPRFCRIICLASNRC